MTPIASRSIQLSVAEHQPTSAASTSARKVGADSSGLSGMAAVTTSGSFAELVTNRLSGIMINTVGDHCDGLRMVCPQFGDRAARRPPGSVPGFAPGRAPPVQRASQDWRRSWH